MISIEVEGIPEIKATLSKLVPKESKAILRRTMTKAAAKIRNDARRRVPTRTRTLKKAIVSKRDRGTRTSIESSVFVRHGKSVKRSAFYWRFIEWGTRTQPGRPYLTPAFEKGRAEFRSFFRSEFFRQLVAQIKKRGARG